MSVKKVNLIIASVFFTSACATGPAGANFRHYMRAPLFQEDINGRIIVNDQTGYKKGEINFRDNPKEEIVREVNRSKHKVKEDDSSLEFYFTYHKCEDRGRYPTEYGPVNILLHVGTLGFWRIGEIKVCKVDLEVKDLKSGSSLYVFTSDFEERTGGNIFEYSQLADSIATGSWAFPARELLIQYQNRVRAKTNPVLQ